jgi:hypothetical protein
MNAITPGQAEFFDTLFYVIAWVVIIGIFGAAFMLLRYPFARPAATHKLRIFLWNFFPAVGAFLIAFAASYWVFPIARSLPYPPIAHIQPPSLPTQWINRMTTEALPAPEPQHYTLPTNSQQTTSRSASSGTAGQNGRYWGGSCLKPNGQRDFLQWDGSKKLAYMSDDMLAIGQSGGYINCRAYAWQPGGSIEAGGATVALPVGQYTSVNAGIGQTNFGFAIK